MPDEKSPCPSGVMSHHTPSICSVRKRPVAVVLMPSQPPKASESGATALAGRGAASMSNATSATRNDVRSDDEVWVGAGAIRMPGGVRHREHRAKAETRRSCGHANEWVAATP